MSEAKTDIGRKSATRRVALLRYEKCSEAAIAGVFEALQIANVVAARKAGNPRRFEVAVVGSSELAARRSPAYDVLVVPPMWYFTASQTEARIEALQPEIRVLREASTRFSIVSSACSGAVLLAEAGLLDGRTAITSWWLGGWFRKRYRRVSLNVGESFIKSGKIWTTAAYASFFHLALELVRTHLGDATMRLTAKLLLVEPQPTRQSAFLDSGEYLPGDDLVKAALSLVGKRLVSGITGEELAKNLGVTERTLLRRFRNDLGRSPTAVVQAMRVEKAKKLLAETNHPFAHIVTECGREDARSFRRLFVEAVGLSPTEYRRRFRLR